MRRGSFAGACLRATFVLMLLGACLAGAEDVPAALESIHALGRLEPRDGVVEIAGPSQAGAVLARLQVEIGDDVEEGTVLAELDTVDETRARLTRAQAELANARAELGRQEELHRGGTTADSVRDAAQLRVDVARADVAAAQAELDLAIVKAPISGRVLEIHTRAGERVGPRGMLELGRVDEMYAVAEVYETDIRWVRVGQRARVESPALAEPLTGVVERIGQKVQRLEVFSTDPTANTDARVIEVWIKLDDSTRAASLTNLQVEVSIDPRSA